jgi:ribosome-associated toxin RatA of RatAB toxin-antitoxin module
MADAVHEHIEVVAQPATCFALATDFEGYPAWTSDVRRVLVLERDEEGRGTRVEFHVAGLGRRVRYVLDYDFTDAPAAFSWALVEGDLLRALDGRYEFSPTAEGTRVDYTLHVDVAVPMPKLVKRRASGMIMGNALRDLQRTAELQEAAQREEAAELQEAAQREETAELQEAAQRGAAPEQPEPVEQAMTNDEPEAPTASNEPAPVREPSVPHPDEVPFDEAGAEERPLPPPSILESVISELLGAVPEVKDHVLEAADALLDAAKALIDAADRVVRQQRGEE